MQDSDISATVRGIPDLRAALEGIAPKLRRRALRNALAAGARVVRDEARRRAPVLRVTGHMRKQVRKPGTVRDAISVRTSKAARKAGDVGVFVNVRPAKRGQRGAKNPNDPFYWRFLEFGTARMAAVHFLRGSSDKLGEALRVFVSKIGPQIQRLNGGKDVQL
jgi:HK97 gp10 family phage protein